MDTKETSRRQFLVETLAGVTSAWVAANWPGILAAQEHAHRAAADPSSRFEFFTADQAADVEAIAAQIIPSDDTPGAREARVIYFIDRALVTFDRDQQKAYVDGLPQVQAKLKELYPAAGKFSEGSAEQQVAVLKAIEKSEFFGAIRTHTVVGFLADPHYGGNYNKVGWKLIGFDDTHMFEPPFGYYDRDYPGWAPGRRDEGER